jgi:hypothetical protein
MAVGYAIDAKLCPTTPMHIRVDEKGFTLAEAGRPNAQVCLQSSAESFFSFFMGRVSGP